MHVNEDVSEMLKALLMLIFYHVDDCLQDGNHETSHKGFVRVNIWSIEVVCRDETCLAGVRWQAYSRVITREVKLSDHCI